MRRGPDAQRNSEQSVRVSWLHFIYPYRVSADREGRQTSSAGAIGPSTGALPPCSYTCCGCG
eukprot:315271-Lingulodinium_polyedra.AAC.1